MRFQAATVIAGAAMAAGANAQQATQWRVQDGGNGHWYAPSFLRANWDNARRAAEGSGGHLVTITSAAENAFLVSLGLPWTDKLELLAYWTGGSRGASGGNFTWITSEQWDYQNFDASEPNGCCGPDVRYVVFRAHPAAVGRWDDTSSNGNNDEHPQYSLIEWSADCNGDGIVDYGQCRDGSLPDYDGDNVPDCCERGVACEVGAYPVEWRATEGGNGHWYRTLRTTTRTNFDFKVGAARSIGAELASIADGNENQFVFTMAKSSGVFAGRVCLGGRRCDGCQWRWVDGTPWSFEPWGPGEPGNPGDVHVEMFISIGAPGTWADVWDFDGSERAYAVEWSADCDSDGIVDYGQILRGERPDANANGVPDGCECFTDLNSDGYVQGADLGLVLAAWGAAPAGTAADINRDGAVDGTDLGLLLATWGACGG